MSSQEKLDFHQWMDKASAEEKKILAKHANTTVRHLYQMKGKGRNPSPKLAKRLVRASHKKTPKLLLSYQKLLPDVFDFEYLN